MLNDDMAAMGPVRLRDVDEAQALLVNLAKDLAAKGEIVLTKVQKDKSMGAYSGTAGIGEGWAAADAAIDIDTIEDK